ncbi:MAG: ribosome-associated translation inhibitor RaiA [Candidatus Thiodiazotropha sp.]|jgi:putative sigma-54 modulation protein
MQISLTGHHIDITDALKNYVDNKFERLERHFDNVTNVHVILSVEKMRQKAEATMHVNGANVFADSVHEDMYAAIDVLTDKLDRQVIKHKEKMKSHRAGSGVKYAAE